MALDYSTVPHPSELRAGGRYLAVHPTVTLSIVDHHQRVAKDSLKRVSGVLLGETINGQTHATTSFAVPFEEDAKDAAVWYFDHLYMESMAYMFSKINKRDKVIGWYSTGDRIKQSDLAINELIRRYVPHPFYLLVNVKGADASGEPPFRAYVATDEPSDGRRFRTTFVHVPSGVASVEAESVGVEHLLRDLRTFSSSTRAQRLSEKATALKCLEERIADFMVYVQEVQDGKLPPNARILRNLQNLLNLAPNLDDEVIVQAFRKDNEEGLFAMYMGSVVRAVTAMHALVRNRINRGEEKKPAAKKEPAATAPPPTAAASS